MPRLVFEGQVSMRGCPIHQAMEVLGRRWAMVVMRDAVLDGCRRFVQFKRANPGITDRMLSRRLSELVEEGFLARRADGTYAPTARGRALEPVLLALADFGMTQFAQQVFSDGQPRSLAELEANQPGASDADHEVQAVAQPTATR